MIYLSYAAGFWIRAILESYTILLTLFFSSSRNHCVDDLVDLLGLLGAMLTKDKMKPASKDFFPFRL
jgi:hypothetical protein